MKVVINKCFGGFGLSEKAMKTLYDLDSKVVRTTTQDKYFGTRRPDAEYRSKQIKLFELALTDSGDIIQLNDSYDNKYRSDPHLVKVVEDLGEESWGAHAELKVVEIPDGVSYCIKEYDGNEHIAEEHRTWG